uniref:Cohesin subunit SA-2 n=1 Tax=Diachasma muliebre TaxID=1309577 RepID=A0A291S6X7_9HYME|nr:cohesin subunit SA-2 [Diachasma muliebre]
MAPTSRRRSRKVETMEVDDASPPIGPGPAQSSNSSSSEATPPNSSSSPADPPPPSPSSRRSLRPRQPRRNPPIPELDPSDSNPEDNFLPPRSRSKPSRRRPSPPPNPLQNRDSLFNLMKSPSIDTQAVASEWIDCYKTDRSSATAELLEFFLNSAGSSLTITPEMLVDFNDITKEMILEACQDNPKVFPLTTKTSTWKTFTSNFLEFLRVLFLQCQNSIIYDGFLLESITHPLTFFSSVPLGHLRYTSTLILLKLTTILEEIDTNVRSIIEKNRRQLHSEMKRPPPERSLGRIEALDLTRTELQENRDVLSASILNISSNLFSPRCKDNLLGIRLISIEELAKLLDKKPLKYIGHLKHIGYGLSDVTPEVRLRCAEVLQSVYQSEDLKFKLGDFNDKFKHRFAIMGRDRYKSVGVEAVKLMKIIYQNHKEILSNDDYELIYDLVYNKHRELAQVAGEFVKAVCSDDDSSPQDGDSSNDSVMGGLVAFFAESERPHHAVYLVDALIDDNEFMQDWGCMTKLLLHGDLDDATIVNLVKIMVASVQQSATGESPYGRARQKPLTMGEQRETSARKEKLTEHFIQNLPRLLGSFNNEPEVATHLLMIPQYFYLDMYVKSHEERRLTDLLDEIRIIIDKTSDSCTLREASKTLEWLCSERHPKSSQCKTETDNILSRIIKDYEIAMDDYQSVIAGEPTPHDDETTNVVETLKKIGIFSQCHDLNLETSVFESILEVIDSCREPASDLEEGFRHAAWAVFQSIVWWKYRLSSGEGLGDREEEEVRRLRDVTVKFVEDMKFFLVTENNISPGIRADAFRIICDLLIPVCEGLFDVPNPLHHEVIYEPDEDLGNTLNDFLQEYVFVQDDSDSIDFCRRRNLLMAFCKLIICKVFKMKMAVGVFKHYDAFYNDYGDIIKMCLMTAKGINLHSWALTIGECLASLYEEARNGKGDGVDPEDMLKIITLAKKFAMALGINTTRIQEEIAAIHFKGIDFVVKVPTGEIENTQVPPKIGYLEVLVEFSGKLLKEKKAAVLKVLDTKLLAGVEARGIEWQPLVKYRTSLNARKGGRRDSGVREGEGSAGRGGQRRKTPRKPPLDVTRVKGPRARAPGDEAEAEESAQSVSRYINERLRRDDENERNEENRRNEGAGSEAGGSIAEPMDVDDPLTESGSDQLEE